MIGYHLAKYEGGGGGIYYDESHRLKMEVIEISLCYIPFDPKFCADQSLRKHQHLKMYLSWVIELFL